MRPEALLKRAEPKPSGPQRAWASRPGAQRPGPRRLCVAVACTDPGIPVFGQKGASIHLQEVLRAFLRAGHRPVLFTPRPGGAAPPGLEDIPVVSLPPAEGADAGAREEAMRQTDTALLEALERGGPFDLVLQRYSLFSDAGMRVARQTGTPGILEVNAPLVDEQARHRTLVDRAGAVAGTRRALEAADLIVAVSPAVARWTRTMAPAAASRVKVVPNGVDPTRFLRAPIRDLEPSDAVMHLGFVGTLKPWHGVSALLDALARLIRGGGAWHVTLVGDGPERDALEHQAEVLGVARHVTFLGAVPHERIPGLLAGFDVALAPYPDPGDDGFYFSPLKVMEYLAAGVPVVASRVGTLESLIESGTHGLLVEPGNPDALATALKELRRQPDLRRSLGEAGHNLVRQRHTWDGVVETLLEGVGLASPRASAGRV